MKHFKSSVFGKEAGVAALERRIILLDAFQNVLNTLGIKGAHDREQGNRKIPNNSIDCLFTILKQIQADKRRTANAWVTRTITKKQRDMLALLSLENPPRVLKN